METSCYGLWICTCRRQNANYATTDSTKSSPPTRRKSFKDSTATIREFECLRLDGPVLLVTCDVESLYTNISHTDGVAAVTYFLERRSNPDESSVDFLDLTLMLKTDQIETKLHRKETATNSLLLYSSFHPYHLKKGLPTGQFLRNPSTGEQITLSNYINCKTKMVVYGLKCSCPKLYIGQTKQELRKRVQKHISTITLADRDKRAGKTLTSVAEHFLQVHKGRTSDLTVFGLEKLKANIRGGDPVPALLRKESRWIYNLQTLIPDGLNEELLYTGFLDP